MKARTIVLTLFAVLLITVLIWVFGFAIWGWFHIYNEMARDEYLVTLLVVNILAGGLTVGFALRTGKVPRRPKRKSKVKTEGPNIIELPIDVEVLDKKLAEILEKVCDIHSMMEFLKNVPKEKKGDKH